MNQEMLNDVELDSDNNNESPRNIEPSQEIMNNNINNKDNKLSDIDNNNTESKEEEVELNENVSKNKKPETWWDTAYNFGENVLYIADFLGEVFAEFFGMTQSRYQWAIDAYERQQRWEKEEKRKEDYHKQILMEQYKKNKKAAKQFSNKDIELNDIEFNENKLSLSINKNKNKNGVIDEEEMRMNYISTNHFRNDDQCENDGKEEEEEDEEPQNEQQQGTNNNNDAIEVS